MIHRLLALLGVIAFAIRRTFASILSLIGLGFIAAFVVPALILLLAALAVGTALETARILETRPQVTESTLADVAADDGEGSVWFEFDALIDESFLPTPADRGTFFYFARDPGDPGRGLLVRSPQNDLFFRERVVRGVLVDDPELVADALGRLEAPPAGIDVESSLLLDETGIGDVSEETVEPSDLDGLVAGTEGVVAGRVLSPGAFSACAEEDGCQDGGGIHLYLFADQGSGSAIVLRSPHPPDALPVRLEGLHLLDTFDLAAVLESEWFAEIDAEVPTNRAFSAGSQPPITVPASWVPSFVYGGIAVLLLASLLVGYPVFTSTPAPGASRTLEAGEGVPILISGQLANPRARIAVDGSPGTVQRMGAAELAMIMWRYGLAGDLSRREAEERFSREAGAGTPLVIHERDQSALVVVEPAGGADAQAGNLYRVGRRSPAVRFRQGASNALLTTRSSEDRDRIAAEIAAEGSPES